MNLSLVSAFTILWLIYLERSYMKTNTSLKKDLKQNWGRFLDNHYDPDIHQKPFNAAMNYSKDTYKYSSAGLSHKFINPHILQSIDVEQKQDRTKAVFRFKEFREIQEEEIFVFIEYCANSEKTQLSTSHSEKKYITFAKRFRQGIIEKFPQVKVYIKSTHNTNKVTKYRIVGDPNGNIIDEQREPLRIGAFEVSLAVRKDGYTRTFNIHSKLKSNCFPKLSYVLFKVCEHVEKCNLVVNICDNINDSGDKLQPEKAEGMKVLLRCSYKTTQASNDLEGDIRQIDFDRSAMTPQKSMTKPGFNSSQEFNGTSSTHLARRAGSVARGNIQITTRPYSAKTEFTPSMSRNPQSRRNFSNRMMSSQHMLRQNPSMKTLPHRPQTSVSHSHMKANSSVGRMKSMGMPYGGGPRTITNISAYRKSKHNKKKPKMNIEDLVFEATVNEEGSAVFEDIPKAVYDIEASENDFFKSGYKVVCLPQEAEIENQINVYLPIDRQDAYTTTIYMSKTTGSKQRNSVSGEGDKEEDKMEDEEENEANKYFDNLELRAVLLKLYERKNADDSENSQDSDLESEVDFEEEFEQYEDKNGK